MSVKEDMERTMEMLAIRQQLKQEMMRDMMSTMSKPVAIVMCIDDLDWNDYHIRNTNELITWIGTGVNNGKQSVIWKSDKAPGWKILG